MPSPSIRVTVYFPYTQRSACSFELRTSEASYLEDDTSGRKAEEITYIGVFGPIELSDFCFCGCGVCSGGDLIAHIKNPQ